MICARCGGDGRVPLGVADWDGNEAWDRCDVCEGSGSVSSVRNQCDGCARGLPVKDGTHYNPDGSYDFIACTKHLYTGSTP